MNSHEKSLFNADQALRQQYKGGVVDGLGFHPLNEFAKLGETMDVNSIYPAAMAEFEAPEADPAEADPAEAVPDWARASETDTCGCGQPATIVSRYGVALCMNSARAAGLGELSDSLNACPVHGAGCVAWEA